MKCYVLMDASGTPANRLDPRAKRVWRIYAVIDSALSVLQQPLKPIENQIEAELEGRVFIVGLVGVLHRNRGE